MNVRIDLSYRRERTDKPRRESTRHDHWLWALAPTLTSLLTPTPFVALGDHLLHLTRLMSTAARSSTLSIAQTAPAGVLTITQPPQTTIAFFKIAQSQPITFAWNTSYVLSTPAHLTVSAICENGNTFPVGPTDGIIAGTASSVVWDVYSWQKNNPNSPLPQATYTLEIFDDRGPGSARSPGLLQPNNALRFALYSPQSYTPIGSGKLPWTFFVSCKTYRGLLFHRLAMLRLPERYSPNRAPCLSLHLPHHFRHVRFWICDPSQLCSLGG